MIRNIICTALLLALSLTSSLKAKASFDSLESIDVKKMEGLLILEQGRQKPLGTYAQNVLVQFSGKSSYNGQSAMNWLARVFFRAEGTNTDNIFLINNPQVMEDLGVKPKDSRKYSYEDVSPGLQKLSKRVMTIFKIEEKKRSGIQRELLRLYHNLNQYVTLMAAFQYAIPRSNFSILDSGLAVYLGMEPNRDYSFYDLFSKGNLIYLVIGKLQTKKSTTEWTSFEREALRLSQKMYDWAGYYKNINLGLIPTMIHDKENWLSPPDAINNRSLVNTVDGDIKLLAQVTVAYLNKDQTSFDKNILEYQLHQKGRIGEKIALASPQLELLYNKINAFFWLKVLYAFASIVLLFSLMFWRKWMYRLGLSLSLVAFALHTFGMISRMIIMGRPPVTNLYETFIFVGWMCFLLGIISEWIQKKTIGVLVSCIAGFLMMMIAAKYALEGDTMGMLVAVLDSNFWLATHVVTITMGYAGACLAGVVGHVYIIQELLKTDKKTLKETYRSLYGILAFGLVLSFVGTVLGGIWADQSWGRFWGWDPKENGALLIVLWCAILLHARLDGMLQGYGMAVGSILGIIVVMFAWFGVNLLGVGLHSYGFTSGIFINLMVYIGVELLFLFVTALIRMNQQTKKRVKS